MHHGRLGQVGWRYITTKHAYKCNCANVYCIYVFPVVSSCLIKFTNDLGKCVSYHILACVSMIFPKHGHLPLRSQGFAKFPNKLCLLCFIRSGDELGNDQWWLWEMQSVRFQELGHDILLVENPNRNLNGTWPRLPRLPWRTHKAQKAAHPCVTCSNW